MTVGLFLIVLGVVAILAHKSLARQTLEYNSELFRTKLGPRVAIFANWLYITIGIIMMIAGLLAAFGIVATK